jgi:hypothetical protein
VLDMRHRGMPRWWPAARCLGLSGQIGALGRHPTICRERDTLMNRRTPTVIAPAAAAHCQTLAELAGSGQRTWRA